MNTGSVKTVWLSLLLVLSLAGCSNTDMSDLQAQIDRIKASRKGTVPPLPEFTPIESYSYAMKEGADPFVSWEVRAAVAVQKEDKTTRKSNGLQPDLSRRREPLEQFPLDTLRMVGTLQRENENSGLVASPDGLISRIIVGNHLGQNHGRVVAILADKIEVMEIVPDGLGGWQRRPASLALVEPEKTAR